MADRGDLGVELAKNAQYILPAAAAAYLSVMQAKTHQRAKEAAEETRVGNAKVADVAAKVDAIASQATVQADGCETFARLVAENADLRREIERLKRERPVDGES